MPIDPPAAFGDLLRRARRHAGLTQEELAERAGLSTRAISDLERGVNRAPRRDTLNMLAEALELPPEIVTQWEQTRQWLATRSPSPVHANSHPHTSHLPVSLNTLVGREQEIRSVVNVLREPGVRLVTLSGPGGVGKTRLALAVVRELEAAYRDGVWFVQLAPVRDPALVGSAIAAELGIREIGGQQLMTTLQAWLRPRQALIVVDNFEHVLGAAPLLTELLIACPSTTMLVTSRSRLQLSGEHDVLVEPFALPDLDDVHRLLRNPSVRLFTERGQALKPSFSITADNAEIVAAICC